ncbi:MAG TPA: glycosyltransferase family 1 protein [Armatimonadota bacterium]
MRIGIHAHLLHSGESYRNAGISQYIRYLLTALQTEAHDHELIAFVNSGFSEPGLLPNTRIIQSRAPGESAWRRMLFEQMSLPLLTARLRLDVLHGTAFALPIAGTCPGVVSVMDVGFLRFSDKHLSANRRYLTAISKASARRAKRIIGISKATAEDCISLLGAPRDRVRIVYCGVDHEIYRPQPAADVAAFRTAKGLPDRFALFVGTLEPRKNLWSLLRAFSKARKNGLEQDLVVVGGAGWLFEDMLRRVRDEGLDDGVRFVGYASTDEMSLWYAAAEYFVYPSLLEGFGLPVAEAMACGTPVITSNVSSLPEVGGDAVEYVTPTDVEDIATRLSEVGGDADKRSRMRCAGLDRASGFRWDEAARQTLAVYEEARAL